MKSVCAWALLLAMAPVAGCATDHHDLLLAAVGPPQLEPAAPGSEGSLIVYSAYDPHADIDALPERLRYTDYQLFTTDGRLLQSVRNDDGTAFGGPRKVCLPEGTYRVVARANGFGRVTIPVLIAAHQVTTVHLEGSGSSGSDRPSGDKDSVCLPDGSIVGWRAPAKTGSPRRTSAPARGYKRSVHRGSGSHPSPSPPAVSC